MKLPPVGLVAPTLCPRCDTPTAVANDDRTVDQCAQCGLQLRWCGNCHGVAGPFDHYCGFCGFEVIRGAPRSPLWRLWVLVAVVPLAAGLAYGAWIAGPPNLVAGVRHALLKPTPAPAADSLQYDSRGLGLRYGAPRTWTVVDYSSGDNAQPTVVASQNADDQGPASDAMGNLALVDHSQATLIALGRPPLDSSLIGNTRDPVAALTTDVAPLLAAPPPGARIEVSRPVRALTIGGHPAAEVVLKLTRSGSVSYLRRELVYAPRGSLPPMLRADALMPSSEWPAADSTMVASVLRSVTFF